MSACLPACLCVLCATTKCTGECTSTTTTITTITTLFFAHWITVCCCCCNPSCILYPLSFSPPLPPFSQFTHFIWCQLITSNFVNWLYSPLHTLIFFLLPIWPYIVVQCCCCLSDSNCLLPLPLTPKKSLQTGTRLSFAGHCHPSSKGANYFSAFFSKHLSPSFPFFDFSGLVTLSPTFSSFFFLLLLLLLLLLFLLPNFSALSSSSQSLTFWWTVFN